MVIIPADPAGEDSLFPFDNRPMFRAGVCGRVGAGGKSDGVWFNDVESVTPLSKDWFRRRA